jgi:hypothetical protein
VVTGVRAHFTIESHQAAEPLRPDEVKREPSPEESPVVEVDELELLEKSRESNPKITPAVALRAVASPIPTATTAAHRFDHFRERINSPRTGRTTSLGRAAPAGGQQSQPRNTRRRRTTVLAAKPSWQSMFSPTAKDRSIAADVRDLSVVPAGRFDNSTSSAIRRLRPD